VKQITYAYLGLFLGLALFLPTTVGAAAADEGPIIADIVVQGGVTLTVDTVSYYLGLEPGDHLDVKAIADGFHRLWDSGLFENLRVEREDLPDGKVKLYIIVKERPFVTSVTFEGHHKLTTSDIKDKLDEKGVEIPRNVPLKLGDLNRIQTALKEIYDAEGYRSAEITYKIEDTSKTEKRVVFNIEEGGRVKIREIDFTGNEVFSDSRLRRALKKTKEASWYRLFGKKIIYSKEAWEEDRDNLRKFYLNHGYKDVKIGNPKITLVARNPNAESLKKKKYRLEITIPVEEGEPYTMGSLKLSGVKVLDAAKLTELFDVKPGKRYRFKEIDDGMETVRDLYHNLGYIYAYTNQVLENRKGADHVVDVTIDVFEGDRYHLGRLEFKGNTNTRDKVLRREFFVSEGDWMNMAGFKSSVYKVNALGFWKLEDDPLEFKFDDEAKRVNVTVKGHEVGRNDIQFGAGYSQLDGLFGQAMFNTRNFLGRGDILGLSLQTGQRTNYYTLSFTEPYFLDRRILLGGSLFKTSIDVADFYRETKGASATVGFGLARFGSLSFLVSYEDVFSRYSVFKSGVPGNVTGGHRPPVVVPPQTQQPLTVATEVFVGKVFSITPGYNYDSRDDPFDPNRGTRFSLRLRMAGGPLGGDFDYFRPEIAYSLFLPLTKRTVFAFNIEGGQFFPYNGSEIPIYERYRLGGDRSLRGFSDYTVLPRDANGNYFVSSGGSKLGGDRFWQVNLEYQFKVGGPVKIVLFSDLGNTYFDTQGWDFANYRRSAGLELRVTLPMFQAPLRFIYGVNLDPYPDENKSNFQFSIGTTF